MIKKILFGMIFLFTTNLYAGVFLLPAKIIGLRPYLDSSDAIIKLSQADINICGGNKVYKLRLNKSASKEAYSAALYAFASNSNVILEIDSETGCQWGTYIRSINLVK